MFIGHFVGIGETEAYMEFSNSIIEKMVYKLVHFQENVANMQ